MNSQVTYNGTRMIPCRNAGHSDLALYAIESSVASLQTRHTSQSNDRWTSETNDFASKAD